MRFTYSICVRCQYLSQAPVDLEAFETRRCGNCSAELPLWGAISYLDHGSLHRLIQISPLPVLAHFRSLRKPRCHRYDEDFATVAYRSTAELVAVALNVDVHASAKKVFAIEAFPTVILFTQGKEYDRHVGSFSSDQLVFWLNRCFAREVA